MTEKITNTTKVLELFESDYTEQLYDRKANAILKFCKERKEGICYDELEDITKIVRYAVRDLGEGIMEMKAALKKLCETCSLPFKKNKASDEFNYSKALPDFLDAFRPLIVTSKFIEANLDAGDVTNRSNSAVITNVTEDLRLSVIDFLYAFVNEGIEDTRKSEESYEEKKIQGVGSSPMLRLIQNGTKNLRAFDQADLAENIVYLMQSYTQHSDLSHILEVICVCGLYQKLAYKYVNFGILKDIINVIFETSDYRSYIVKLGFEIIWNFLESVGVSCLKSFASEDIINNLKKLFESIMKTGYKLEDKGLRNEILILINYLMSDESALYYFYEKQSLPTHSRLHTFLEILLYYATIDEMTFYNHPIRTNEMRAYFNTTSEDLEFKKLIWSGILTSLQSNQPKAIETVKNSPFISALILYIDPLANSYAVNRWSAPQLREIQLHCLSILANLILYMKEEFYDKNGLFALTKFLTNTTDAERREKCLKAFANASLFDEEVYKLKISDEGIVDILLDFIQTESDSGLEIKESCFSILSNLCKNCIKNKKLFRKKGGIDLIINSLRDSNIGISSRYALYTIAVLDCLWNAVLGNRKNEIWFLENEGLYVLMEFLETSSDLPRKMCLSCLSNLIENPKSISYFCDWNSTRTMINSTQLLIKLYEKEEVKYSVKYRNGILMDIDRPLNPKTRKYKASSIQAQYALSSTTSNHLPDDDDAQSDDSLRRIKQQIRHDNLDKLKGFARLKEALLAGENDTSAGTEAYLVKKLIEKAEQFDLRAIIFATLYRTGFDRNELEPQERQLLEVIQLYPHFKMGEIWSDIKFELEEERVKPTADDYHWMMTNIEEIEDKIISCVSTQTLIAKEQRKIQEEELNKFFEIIRSNKLNK